MALSILPLTNTHLLCLATRPHSGDVNLNDPSVRDNLLKGECFAAVDRGEVYGAAGVIPMWKGVGWGWGVISVPTGTRRLLYFTREVRRYLETTAKWHRVQTTVCADFAHGLAWASHVLGFTPEGYHLKYDEQGRTHISLARVS
jgi:hypothetical protein